MRLNPADDKVLSFQIIGFSGGFTKDCGIGDENFVGIDEMSDKILRGSGLDGQFLDAGRLGQRFQTAGSKHVECPEALGDFINCGEQFLVLPLKGDVKLEKIRSFDIPMREMGLCHEGVGIGEQSLQAFDDGVRFVFGGGLSAHRKLEFRGKDYARPAACATRHSPLC